MASQADDFNSLLKANLPKKLAKRELLKVLEASKVAFQTKINETKQLESLFQQETWTIFSSAVETFDFAKNDELKRLVLELIKLFTIIAPKNLQLNLFKEVVVHIKRINSDGDNAALIYAILSKIYGLLFSEGLLTGEFEEIETLMKTAIASSTGKINLEYLRLMQVVILSKSLRVSEEDEEGDNEEAFNLQEGNWDSDKLGISLIAKNEEKRKLFNQFQAEGNELFDQFLRIHRELKPAMLTGWINLLHPIVKTRPSFYPSLIPTLLSFTESKWSESFTPSQRRNILHTLKAELSGLMCVPRAEKFYSLILDSLDKCTALSASGNAGAGSKKRNASVDAPSIEEVEEEERELAASLGGIQDRMGQRPSGAFADFSTSVSAQPQSADTFEFQSLASEALSRELLKIPSPLVTEMVVRMLGSWSLDQIRPVIMTRWARNRPAEESVNLSAAPEVVLKKTTEEAFTLEAGPLTSELPGEIIHLSVSRILQSITDLSEYHSSSRRDDLVASLDDDYDSSIVPTANSSSGAARGIPIPLVPLCRIVALVAAHVGHVRSDILMDPEDRRKKLDRQFDPRFRAASANKEKKEADDIFGSSDEDGDVKMEDSAEEFDKTVNQIVLGWINEDLPGRFDFVWYWLEGVWVREGKSGNLKNADESSEVSSDYDKLFDDIIGLVGEYFIADEEDDGPKEIVPGTLERVLKVLLKVPKLNASFIRNFLYPLIEEARYRPVALQSLGQLLLQRPASRAMLTDFVMTLAESEDSDLRRDTIEILLLKQGLYPNLRSLSSQLEAYSLDLMDDLASKEQTANLTGENAMKKLKLESSENLAVDAETTAEGTSETVATEALEDFSDFEASTELFLGLLKRNPEKLFPPLLVRFPRLSVKLQAFLLDRSLPQVVHSWSLRELSGLLRVLQSDSKVDEGGMVGELVIQVVKLVLQKGSLDASTDADVVDFYGELAELVQSKVRSGTWDGRLISDLLSWILADRSDLPDFFNIYLPKLITTCPADFLETCTKVCSLGGGQLVSPTQIFVQIHLMTSSTSVSVPLKNLIEVLQLVFGQAKSAAAVMSNSTVNVNAKNESSLLFTASVISSGLGQLVDQTPLPALLGRSLLQSIPLLNPSGPLNAPFLLSLLARLIPRKIWDAGKLWEGWIRCCRALLPGSLSVLLQLPTTQLEKLLQEGGGGADLKGPLREYLYNQPPSVRNRYASILSAIEK